jgi:DUF971 family protein
LKDPDPFPVSVDLVRAENSLEILWGDGTRSRLTGGELRWACPCAGCRGEAGIPGRLDLTDQLDERELRLANAGLIGQYALQITFESGHNTGIYSFRHLRGLGDS